MAARLFGPRDLAPDAVRLGQQFRNPTGGGHRPAHSPRRIVVLVFIVDRQIDATGLHRPRQHASRIGEDKLAPVARFNFSGGDKMHQLRCVGHALKQVAAMRTRQGL